VPSASPLRDLHFVKSLLSDLNWPSKLTPEQQLEILDTHSIFERFHREIGHGSHKKKMGVWKLSVFRPERKNDSGEFIPP
jgi:hypothetical protein